MKNVIYILLLATLGFAGQSSGTIFEVAFTTNTLSSDSISTDTWGISPKFTVGYEFAMSKIVSLSLNLDYMKVNPDVLLYDLITTGSSPVIDTIEKAINQHYLSIPIVLAFMIPIKQGGFRFDLTNKVGFTDLGNDDENPKTTMFVGGRIGGEIPVSEHHILIHSGYEFGYHTINYPNAPKEHIFTVLALAFRLNYR